MVTLCQGRRVPSLIHAEFMADHTVVLSLSGVAAYQSPDQVTGAVQAAIVRWAPQAILLDLADVSVLDNAGVAALLGSQRMASWADISFALINVSTFVQGQLRETGLIPHIEPPPDVAPQPQVTLPEASAG